MPNQQYGRYSPNTPQSNQQNQNSVMGKPKASSVRNQMNIPTPTQPQGHRQTPFGGRTTGPSMNMGTTQTNPRFNPNEGRSTVNVNENPNAYQDQLALSNKLQNRGGYGMDIPKGNPQSAPPTSIYQRPQSGRRF